MANVDLCFKVTKHVQEHNSVPVVVNMDIVGAQMAIAKVATVIPEHVPLKKSAV